MLANRSRASICVAFEGKGLTSWSSFVASLSQVAFGSTGASGTKSIAWLDMPLIWYQKKTRWEYEYLSAKFASILYNTIRNAIYNMLAKCSKPSICVASEGNGSTSWSSFSGSLRSPVSLRLNRCLRHPSNRVRAHHLRLISQNGYQRDWAGMSPSAPQDAFVVIPNPNEGNPVDGATRAGAEQ